MAAFVLCTAATAQNVGINISGAAPNTNAMLDIDATGLTNMRGLLIPRMTEAQRTAIPVTAADDALIVYQTDIGTAQDTTSARGLWYYDAPATSWRHLSAVRSGWRLRGNNVASAVTEYFGTLSNLYPGNKNLVFRSVPPPANPAMQMGYAVMNYQQGFVGLGTPAPATERLEVQGAIHFATNSPNTDPALPREGTLRYGTLTGAAPSTTDHKWHWGTLDTAGASPNIYWGRLENAENFITPPKPYAKDTLRCLGDTSNTYVGQLSPTPVTNTTSTPCNYYSPFATNSDPSQQPIFRVQYLYRYQELVDAGICFPATITDFAFFCLDQETLTNPNPPYTSPATSLQGNVRGGAASGGLTGPGAYFGLFNTPPYMDNNIRVQAPVRASFSLLTPGPGWVNFHLAVPITLAAGNNLIIDIDWLRSKGTGMGPRVELMDAGFKCTKWVSRATGVLSLTDAEALQDNPLSGGATVDPTADNPHNWRPVTRFRGTAKTPGIVAATANYLQYDGGVMIGSPAWANAATTYSGPGTVKAEKGVYDGNLMLSDHVFDRYFDGAPAPQDAQAAQGYAYVGLPQLRDQLARDRHLPNMPSRQEWEAAGGASLGRIATGLWESVEDQALYITQLEQDLSALEELSFGKALLPVEAEKLIAGVRSSKRLTEAQKMHLVEAINQKTQPQAK